MTPKEKEEALILAKRMRNHVLSRGGPAKDENGKYVLENGAWVSMLKAADIIEELLGHKSEPWPKGHLDLEPL